MGFPWTGLHHFWPSWQPPAHPGRQEEGKEGAGKGRVKKAGSKFPELSSGHTFAQAVSPLRALPSLVTSSRWKVLCGIDAAKMPRCWREMNLRVLSAESHHQAAWMCCCLRRLSSPMIPNRLPLAVSSLTSHSRLKCGLKQKISIEMTAYLPCPHVPFAVAPRPLSALWLPGLQSLLCDT